jgi:flavin-dependent dehydrogenase
MGLIESFLAEGHAPCYGNRSVWGDAAPRETDSLRDPDGHGWHLDRVRFERWLRDAAVARGAEIVAPTEVHASLVLDCSGRAASAARRFGAQVRVGDRLVCGFVYGRDEGRGGRGLTYVEAVEEGWWYTAPMPGARRVLAFHTDADLPAARIAHDRDALLAHARHARELCSLLEAAGFVADETSGFTAANSAILEPCAGDGFLAAGDAALAFDPLSSQGLLNALFTGLAAAEAADSHLRGDASALSRYRATIAGIVDAYESHLREWYSLERRWPDAPFWQRRH